MDVSRKCKRCAACRYAFQECQSSKQLCCCDQKDDISCRSICSIDSNDVPCVCKDDPCNVHGLSRLQDEIREIKCQIDCLTINKNEKCSLLVADLTKRYSRLLCEYEQQQKLINRLKNQNQVQRSESSVKSRIESRSDFQSTEYTKVKGGGMSSDNLPGSVQNYDRNMNVLKNSADDVFSQSHRSIMSNQNPNKDNDSRLAPILEGAGNESEFQTNEVLNKHHVHVREGGKDLLEDTAEKELVKESYNVDTINDQKTVSHHTIQVKDVDEEKVEKSSKGQIIKEVQHVQHVVKENEEVKTQIQPRKYRDIDTTSDSSINEKARQDSGSIRSRSTITSQGVNVNCKDKNSNPVFLMCIEPTEINKILCNGQTKLDKCARSCPRKDDKTRRICCRIQDSSESSDQDVCLKIKKLTEENNKLREKELQSVEENCALGKTIAKLQMQLTRTNRNLERYRCEARKARKCGRGNEPAAEECCCPKKRHVKLNECKCNQTVIEPQPPNVLNVQSRNMHAHIRHLEDRDRFRLREIHNLKLNEKQLCAEIARLKKRTWELSKMVTESEITIARLNQEIKEKDEMIQSNGGLLHRRDDNRSSSQSSGRWSSIRASREGKKSKSSIQIQQNESVNIQSTTTPTSDTAAADSKEIPPETKTDEDDCTIHLSGDMQKLIAALYNEMEKTRVKEEEIICKNKNICCLEYALCERNRELERLKREIILQKKERHITEEAAASETATTQEEGSHL